MIRRKYRKGSTRQEGARRGENRTANQNHLYLQQKKRRKGEGRTSCLRTAARPNVRKAGLKKEITLNAEGAAEGDTIGPFSRGKSGKMARTYLEQELFRFIEGTKAVMVGEIKRCRMKRTRSKGLPKQRGSLVGKIGSEERHKKVLYDPDLLHQKRKNSTKGDVYDWHGMQEREKKVRPGDGRRPVPPPEILKREDIEQRKGTKHVTSEWGRF